MTGESRYPSHVNATIPALRVDRLSFGSRYDLAPPTRVDGGGMVYEMVLAVPGVMEYPWGREYVPASTLSDAEWLRSLEGVPVTDDDTGAHFTGVTVETTHADAIGHILSARWDAEQEAVIARAVIDSPRGLERVAKGWHGVSPSYKADTRAAPAGSGYDLVQTRRYASNNVAITLTPRGRVTTLRADSEGRMAENENKPLTIEDVHALLADRADAGMGADLVKMLARAISERDDAMGQYDALMADMEKMKADMEKANEDKADAVRRADSAVAEAAASVKVAPFRDAIASAEKAGIEIADDATVASLRADTARAYIGGKADGLDAVALDAVIAAAEKVRADAAPEKRADALDQIKANTTPNDSASGGYLSHVK